MSTSVAPSDGAPVADAPAGQSAGASAREFEPRPHDHLVDLREPTRYRLTMHVDDRTSFAFFVQPVGARKRVCSPAGSGGCPKGGMW